MKTSVKNYVLSIPVWLAILLSAVILLDTSAAFGGIPGLAHGKPYGGAGDDLMAETATILSVLKNRIEDPRLLAKTKEKLSSLHGREIRLIASLCDRIPAGEQTAGAEIAFSLVTALIVLS